MDSTFLEEFGLSKNEAKIYLTLLRIGKANSAELARESGIHRINVYDVLNSLIAKSLVSYINESGTRMFKAENPEKLSEILKRKQELLDKELPGILKQFNARKEQWDVSILRGVEGKKSQFEELARVAKNTTNRVFAPHGLISLERAPYKTVVRKWLITLAKRNVETKQLVSDNQQVRQRAKLFKNLPKYHIQFSKDIQFSLVSWDVCANLLFLTFHIEPYLIIRIKSNEIAQAFINSFDLMWKKARK